MGLCELKEMAPNVFKQFSRSRSRNPSPTKRPRLQGLQEVGGVIVAVELGWVDDGDDGDDEYVVDEAGDLLRGEASRRY
jgi:hypothetical protein